VAETGILIDEFSSAGRTLHRDIDIITNTEMHSHMFFLQSDILNFPAG
jgi:hypothetical protein